MRKRSSGRVVGYSYPWDYFRFARNPSRVDAKRGDHFLQADLPLLICRQRVIWRFTARRDCLSGSTGNDHLPNKPVVHREQAIRIPPAPDASASTLRLAFRAGCGPHLQVNELLHEEAYFPNHAPSCDDAAHGEV